MATDPETGILGTLTKVTFTDDAPELPPINVSLPGFQQQLQDSLRRTFIGYVDLKVLRGTSRKVA